MADAHPGDTVSWTGSCAEVMPKAWVRTPFTHDGQAQASTAFFEHGAVPDGHVHQPLGQGWSYNGETVSGRFNGEGILTTDTNDRFEGNGPAAR